MYDSSLTFLENSVLQPTFPVENPQVCNNLNSPELNIFFEINKLKEQLQGKDNTIGKLKAHINNMKDVSTCPSLSTLEIENTKLKEGLTAVRIKNDIPLLHSWRNYLDLAQTGVDEVRRMLLDSNRSSFWIHTVGAEDGNNCFSSVLVDCCALGGGNIECFE
ncbi:hypothetical protein Tco_0529378 [Tanacetum coccineum]